MNESDSEPRFAISAGRVLRRGVQLGLRPEEARALRRQLVERSKERLRASSGVQHLEEVQQLAARSARAADRAPLQ